MDFLIHHINEEIPKEFKSYKTQRIAKKLLMLILNNLTTLHINCNICSLKVRMKDYINHLQFHCEVKLYFDNRLQIKSV